MEKLFHGHIKIISLVTIKTVVYNGQDWGNVNSQNMLIIIKTIFLFFSSRYKNVKPKRNRKSRNGNRNT